MGTTYSYYMCYDEIYNNELINYDYCSRIWKSHTKYLEEDNSSNNVILLHFTHIFLLRVYACEKDHSVKVYRINIKCSPMPLIYQSIN